MTSSDVATLVFVTVALTWFLVCCHTNAGVKLVLMTTGLMLWLALVPVVMARLGVWV